MKLVIKRGDRECKKNAFLRYQKAKGKALTRPHLRAGARKKGGPLHEVAEETAAAAEETASLEKRQKLSRRAMGKRIHRLKKGPQVYPFIVGGLGRLALARAGERGGHEKALLASFSTRGGTRDVDEVCLSNSP